MFCPMYQSSFDEILYDLNGLNMEGRSEFHTHCFHSPDSGKNFIIDIKKGDRSPTCYFIQGFLTFWSKGNDSSSLRY